MKKLRPLPALGKDAWDLRVGHVLDVLAGVPDGVVQTCITSPPYFGLRDYGEHGTAVWGGATECDHEWKDHRYYVEGGGGAGSSKEAFARAGPENAERIKKARWREDGTCTKCGAWRGQLGLEPTPELYVEHLVLVFREVRRVLRDDGTLWLNLGDSYNGYYGNQKPSESISGAADDGRAFFEGGAGLRTTGLKQKDLIGVPWMVAFALRADGWYLRQEIIWWKPNPMPESVTDRPTRSHEQVFLLTKGKRYFYDADAIREADGNTDHTRHVLHRPEPSGGVLPPHNGIRREAGRSGSGRNKRSVWTVATQPFPGAHFATFPVALVEPMVLAGTSPKACGECGAPWQRVRGRLCPACGELVRTQAKECVCGHRNTGWAESRVIDETFVVDPSGATAGRHTPRKPGSMGMSKSITEDYEPICAHKDDSGTCVVLDPFAGAGTVGIVASHHGSRFLGVEVNPEYAELARKRKPPKSGLWAVREGLAPSAPRPRPKNADQLDIFEGL